MMQSMSSSTSNAGNSSNADKFSSTTIGPVLDQLATEPDLKETWNGDVEYSTVVPKNAGLRDELFSKVHLSQYISYILSGRIQKVPPLFFAYSQLNKAVLTPPICKGPVGDGANLVATLDIRNI